MLRPHVKPKQNVVHAIKSNKELRGSTHIMKRGVGNQNDMICTWNA